MDKNAIKKYAVWARNELIARVSQKAQQYGITAEGYGDKNADSVNGVLLFSTEKKQRQALIAKIDVEGFEQVMEEVAYTWFNRFTALRFMEVNNYLPSHTRVFTNEANEFKPQILADAISLELEGLDMEKVYELKDANKDEELYKYLLIVQCNALSSILPGMFQKISDYTELLLPDYLLREGSVVEQMISSIPEADWTDQVQIIGWLYQYYNIEPKDSAFAKLKKKVKISKESLPAATQLFTPDWIVRYLVENSLGKLWAEKGNNKDITSKMKYYLKEQPQSGKTLEEIKKMQATFKDINPETIKCIDPCSGSGHILCYLFDVLILIYEAYGYSSRDAVSSIVEHNLWGLDIDERASQLAYFSVMMKARQYDRRFFSRNIQPNVYAIQESNFIQRSIIDDFCESDIKLKKAVDTILSELKDAKEVGSLAAISVQDWEYIINKIYSEESDDSILTLQAKSDLKPLIKVAIALAQKYDVVVTNPPYMATSNGGVKLNDFVKKNYPDSKADLYAVFIERCMGMAKLYGYVGMITQHTWMFLSTYEKLREKVLNRDLINMAHLGARAFEEIAGEVVQTTAFIRRNSKMPGYVGVYKRLVDESSQDEKEKAFLEREDNLFYCSAENFNCIPGAPVAYWAGSGISKAFLEGKPLGKISVARNGMKTGDNGRFLRVWWEVPFYKLNYTAKNANDAITSAAKWFPYNKGGEARKWYGNNDYVVNWENSGKEIFADAKKDGRNVQDYPLEMKFTPSGTWSLINTGVPTFRYKECNLSDIAGMSFYQAGEKTKYLLGFCNTVVASTILQLLAPTINYQAGDIGRLPIIFAEEEVVKEIVEDCISLVKEDWDYFENSWDYRRHPLAYGTSIEDEFSRWSASREKAFEALKEKETQLNEIFIHTYGLDGYLNPEVADADVSIRKADLKRDIRTFISYAVGCMFGRYSLDVEGVVYAGGNWDISKYSSYQPDKDNIIPISDDEYFDDDIVELFVKFVKVLYGEANLEKNLLFIANALGGKGTSRELIRNYFINEFYSDHCAAYSSTGSGKRPIYWLFDSGKKNGFKCLVYIHRYQSDTLARIRTDYVHEQQSRYRTAITETESRLATATSSERVKLSKQLKDLNEQADEIRQYEEKIHHLADQMIGLDMDNGVKQNYDVFADVLASIK